MYGIKTTWFQGYLFTWIQMNEKKQIQCVCVYVIDRKYEWKKVGHKFETVLGFRGSLFTHTHNVATHYSIHYHFKIHIQDKNFKIVKRPKNIYNSNKNKNKKKQRKKIYYIAHGVKQFFSCGYIYILALK